MKKSTVILLHIAYWMLYWVLVSFIILATFQSRNHIPLRFFFISPIAVLAILPAVSGFYGYYVFLFEKFVNRKKNIRLIAAGALVAAACSFLTCVIMSIVFGNKILFADGFSSATGIFLVMVLLAGIHGAISLVVKGFINWFGDIKLKEELTRKNYEMELALVKSQINPHFLFNTINNIHTLIAKDATSASAYLNKLSDIMRFMLYETKTEKIPLVKELTYIEKFIELQKIRTTNQQYINYAVKGDAGNVIIPPMLLIAFIENAFKHTENKKTENAITINLEIEKHRLVFRCENSFNPNTGMNRGANGLGSELIRKRLTLLYPGKHTLTITNNNEFYKVELILQVE